MFSTYIANNDDVIVDFFGENSDVGSLPSTEADNVQTSIPVKSPIVNFQSLEQNTGFMIFILVLICVVIAILIAIYVKLKFQLKSSVLRQQEDGLSQQQEDIVINNETESSSQINEEKSDNLEEDKNSLIAPIEEDIDDKSLKEEDSVETEFFNHNDNLVQKMNTPKDIEQCIKGFLEITKEE